jgi:LAO/AO transport system kinase
VDALAGQFRQRQQTVGILAIDPTSPFSGGAILGDRIRMQPHTADEGIFIRSMATRGALGGLSSAAADAATVLDAGGRDLVMIETVGAGQDEVDIVRIADLTLVVLVPGMGDDVQSIKAGILEIADIFVINKADREGAARVERELRAMQSLATREDGWVPPIVQTVATSGTGIEALVAAIDRYEIFLATGEGGRERRIANWRVRLRDMLRDELRRRIDAQTISDEAMGRYAAQVAAHERDPYSLIAELAAQAGAQAAGQSAASSATSTAKSCAGQSAEHSAESGASPLAPGKDDTPC